MVETIAWVPSASGASTQGKDSPVPVPLLPEICRLMV